MQKTQTMNRLTLSDTRQFIEIFKLYNKCNDNPEITLNFEKDGLHFREMNPANTLMADITIKDSLFIEFYAEKTR